MSENKNDQEGAVRDESADEWREKYLRTLAELDNYRKRMERERENSRRYALEGLLRNLLPVLDDLQLASAAEGDFESIRKGVEIALRDAMHILGEHGLELIEAMDRPFDPRFHEAMGGIPDTGRAPGTVVTELRRGYVLHDRVIRPSKVQVAVEPPAEPTPGEPTEEE